MVLFTFLFLLIILMIAAVDYREKDGYTIEHVDVYGIVDDTEKVVVHSVCVHCLRLRIDDPMMNSNLLIVILTLGTGYRTSSKTSTVIPMHVLSYG